MTAETLPRPAAADLPAPAAVRARVLQVLGGRRGVVDGALPSLLFVAAHAGAGAHVAPQTALYAALGAAATTGLALVAVRLVRREPLRQALGGLAGLAVAAGFTLTSGEARGFFLPAIVVDAAYGVAFLVSVLIERPLVGAVYGLLLRRPVAWRQDARLRRVFAFATLGWSLVFAVRAGVQAVLYLADRPDLLAAGKLVLGWPLTAVGVLLTVALVGRATGRRAV